MVDDRWSCLASTLCERSASFTASALDVVQRCGANNPCPSPTRLLGKIKEWSRRPLRAVPDEHGTSIVTVSKTAAGGLYTVEYTLRQPGRYRMAVTDATGRVRIDTSICLGPTLADSRLSLCIVRRRALRERM